MKKVFKYIVLALLAAVIIGTFVFLFQKSRPEVVRWQELEATVMDIRKTTVVTGKIEPRNEVDIKPQINGIISEIYKEAGEQVEENEVIAKLKVIPDMSSLSSAESRVRLADINLNQAQTDYEREKMLYDKDLVSAEEYDQVLQALNQAKEERAAAQEALEVIRDGVSSSNATESSTLVRSTITGLILDVPVKVGNSVIQANTMNDGTTIASVANMHDLLFKGKIDETEVGRIHEGMPVKLTVGALQDKTFEATLEYISPKAEEVNGTNQFAIEAALQNTDSATIRSGYSANAEIVLERATNVWTVPEGCIEFSGDSTFVYILTSESPQTFRKQSVITGISDGINIEIKKGISPDDRIRNGIKIIE